MWYWGSTGAAFTAWEFLKIWLQLSRELQVQEKSGKKATNYMKQTLGWFGEMLTERRSSLDYGYIFLNLLINHKLFRLQGQTFSNCFLHHTKSSVCSCSTFSFLYLEGSLFCCLLCLRYQYLVKSWHKDKQMILWYLSYNCLIAVGAERGRKVSHLADLRSTAMKMQRKVFLRFSNNF